jgi:hypothetical protein
MNNFQYYERKKLDFKRKYMNHSGCGTRRWRPGSPGAALRPRPPGGAGAAAPAAASEADGPGPALDKAPRPAL